MQALEHRYWGARRLITGKLTVLLHGYKRKLFLETCKSHFCSCDNDVMPIHLSADLYTIHDGHESAIDAANALKECQQFFRTVETYCLVNQRIHFKCLINIFILHRQQIPLCGLNSIVINTIDCRAIASTVKDLKLLD